VKIAARTLVEWVCRRGDIHVRYDETTEAEEGIATQRRLQRRRGADYVREQRVAAVWQRGRLRLEIGGRIDGLARHSDEILIEEIKTTREDVAHLHAHAGELNLAQARLYAAMLARSEPQRGARWRLRLVYVHPDSDAETAFEEVVDSTALADFFESVCSAFALTLSRQRRHRARRNRTLARLEFPFERWRPAQRELANAVYRAVRDRTSVLAEAPTGSGKTLATLYPALRALGDGFADRVVVVTARGTGQLTVGATAANLAERAGHLRTVTITARQKACLQPVVACDPEVCEYARGYYDRRPAALAEALSEGALDRQAIEAIARRHRVCPFELSLDAAVWSDVVICDYNYVFDPVVRLKRLRGVTNDRTVLLLDEAHQLAPRVQESLTTRIERQALAAARAVAPPVVASALRALDRRLLAVRREHVAAGTMAAMVASPPDALDRAVERALDALAAERSEAQGLREFTFVLARWLRARGWYVDGAFTTVVRGEGADIEIEQRCLDPSTHIASVLATFDASVRFSATLSPPELYARLHGGASGVTLRLPSPFPPEHLGVFVVPDVPVRLRNRATSLDRLVGAASDLTSARPGHYLVALPSFDYLAAVADRFVACYPDRATARQTPRMDETARATFLARFAPDTPPVVGFVVLGGVFAESIDLPGDCLIGMLVAGVGLPPPTFERELEAAAFGPLGVLAAYRAPALARVVQAAGRLIRSAADRAVLCLVDDRYLSPGYRSLLPSDWQLERTLAAHLRPRLDEFWRNG
jgi:DNA excision repair protein ERCC-2